MVNEAYDRLDKSTLQPQSVNFATPNETDFLGTAWLPSRVDVVKNFSSINLETTQVRKNSYAYEFETSDHKPIVRVEPLFFHLPDLLAAQVLIHEIGHSNNFINECDAELFSATMSMNSAASGGYIFFNYYRACHKLQNFSCGNPIVLSKHIPADERAPNDPGIIFFIRSKIWTAGTPKCDAQYPDDLNAEYKIPLLEFIYDVLPEFFVNFLLEKRDQ
jgi:hypothetical protein